MVVGQPYHLREQRLQVVAAQRVALFPSVRLAIALCAVHGAAAALPWLMPIPGWTAAALTAAIAISLAYFLARDATLRAAAAIVELELEDGGRMAYRTRGGRRVDCDVLGSSYVSPQLTLIRLRHREGGGARRVILLPGNVDERDFRGLRTWLRWRRGGDTDWSVLRDC